MGYAPIGIQGDAIKMSERKRELEKIEKYLLDHPECHEYEGVTLEDVRRDLHSINTFEFLP